MGAGNADAGNADAMSDLGQEILKVPSLESNLNKLLHKSEKLLQKHYNPQDDIFDDEVMGVLENLAEKFYYELKKSTSTELKNGTFDFKHLPVLAQLQYTHDFAKWLGRNVNEFPILHRFVKTLDTSLFAWEPICFVLRNWFTAERIKKIDNPKLFRLVDSIFDSPWISSGEYEEADKEILDKINEGIEVLKNHKLVRRELIRSAHKRVVRCIKSGHHLEAIAILDSLMAHRLEAGLSSRLTRTEQPMLPLGTLIRDAISVKVISQELAEKIKAWSKVRNKTLHKMVKVSDVGAGDWKAHMEYVRHLAIWGKELNARLAKEIRKIQPN